MSPQEEASWQPTQDENFSAVALQNSFPYSGIF